MRHRQRAQPQRVDELEDRGVGADAQHQRQDGDHGETAAAPEHARGIAHVVPDTLEPVDRVHVVDFLADAGRVPELAAGGRAGGFGRQTARDVVGDFLIEIAVELLPALGVPGGAA